MRRRKALALLLCASMLLSLTPAAFAAGGSGGSGADEVIRTADQLSALARAVDNGESYEGKTVALGADLDLSDLGSWDPIGAEAGGEALFNGTFDGAGYTIRGLTVSGSYTEEVNVGLFSTLGPDASVRDLTLADVSIQAQSSGSRLRAGGLAGDTAAGAPVVDGVTVTGSVSVTTEGAMGMAGGILGRMSRGASLVNSVTNVTVTSSAADEMGFWGYAGGLTAMTGNGCLAANCAALGTVSGSALQGGVAGMVTGSLYNLYADVSLTGAATEKSGLLAGQTMASGQYLYCRDAGAAFGTVTMGEAAAEAFSSTGADLAETLNGSLDAAAEAAGFSLAPWGVGEDGYAVPNGASGEDDGGDVRAVMNIPYDVFYRDVAGVSGDAADVDAFTSATAKKPAYFWDSSYKGNAPVAYGEGSTLKGIQFPVVLSQADRAKLADLGPADDYYVRDGAVSDPVLQVSASVADDGTVTLQPLRAKAAVLSDAAVTLDTQSRHGQYMLEISNDGGVLTEADKETFQVYGAVLTAGDGSVYPLTHLLDLYYKDFHELAFNTTADTTEKGQDAWATYKDAFASLEGQTVEKITFYTNAGVYEVPAGVTIQAPEASESGYVLMNIPYADFYKAELGENDPAVDAVSSATLNKPRTGTLAGGSYHVNSDGSDISGVIYPVYVEDMSRLAEYEQITDASSVDITVTNRGTTSTTTYSGPEALFEAPDYAYYVLSEAPALYKTLNEDGSFSAVNAQASTVEGVTADLTVGARHADVEIALSGTEGVETGSAVSGVVLTFADGGKMGLRHIENLWRATELGGSAAVLGGKTITNIRYITRDAVIDYPVDIAVSDAGYVLMNIPYADFFKAELGETDPAVDAVSSATLNKPRTGTLAGGSYHVNSDGSDISGVTYPVFVKDMAQLAEYTQITDASSVDITVTNRGNTSTTTYSGPEALFEAPDYAYYVLADKPARYKILNEDGSFSAVSGRASTVEGVTAGVTMNARHADVEIALSGTEGVETGSAVSGVVLTFADGGKMGLRHIENLWRATELGGAASDLAGKTITAIRYITRDAVIDYPVEIAVPKVADVQVQAADAAVGDESTQLTLSAPLPEDFAPVYLVDGTETTASDGALVLPAELAAGSHALTVRDGSGTYADLTASFLLNASDLPAEYNGDEDAPALEKTSAASDGDFANYLKNITQVQVDDAVYAASGRNAAAIVDGQTGAIDLAAKSGDTEIFPPEGRYDVTVSATGYPDLTFTLDLRPSTGGGGGGSSVTTSYPVTVSSAENGSVTASVSSARQGTAVTLTVNADDGWKLDSLRVTDRNGRTVSVAEKDGAWRFTMPASPVTVAPSFVKADSAAAPASDGRFADVPADSWYAGGVDWAAGKGLMDGVSQDRFDPGGSTTRAMIVTILHRMEGAPAAAETSPFTDVVPGSWYAAAVDWAAENGIVNGCTETTFGPMDPVTREQLAAILYRYAQTKGQGFADGQALSLDYPDADQVSSYAYEPLCWLTARKVIEGADGGLLAPRAGADRAQIAVMLQRLDGALSAEKH